MLFPPPLRLLTESEGHSNLSIQSRILLLISCLVKNDPLVFLRGKHTIKRESESESDREKIIASSITDRSLFFFLYFFFQNNKNSLTNKDFFILSISTRIYSWGWNKRLVVSISSHSWLRSHPDRPSPTPRQAWQESTRGLLLCLWRGIQAIQWLVTRKSKQTSLTFAFLGASPFCSELRQRQACLYIRQVTLISRFMIDDACFSLTGMTLEDNMTRWPIFI